jgi:drug/metabolite transporter (DMT)-like permease
VLYLGIFPGALAASLWGFVISRMPASRAANLLFLAPALAFLIAWVWLGEIPTATALAGGVLVVGGVVIVNARR